MRFYRKDEIIVEYCTEIQLFDGNPARDSVPERGNPDRNFFSLMRIRLFELYGEMPPAVTGLCPMMRTLRNNRDGFPHKSG